MGTIKEDPAKVGWLNLGPVAGPTIILQGKGHTSRWERMKYGEHNTAGYYVRFWRRPS